MTNQSRFSNVLLPVTLHPHGQEDAMITLCIRYTFSPDKVADLKTYLEAEQEPIRRSGGTSLGYFLPSDFAGPTNEALWLIDFATLADYERYRGVLGSDPEHKTNVARLAQSGTGMVMNRSIMQRGGNT
jgi:NIPSNAP